MPLPLNKRTRQIKRARATPDPPRPSIEIATGIFAGTSSRRLPTPPASPSESCSSISQDPIQLPEHILRLFGGHQLNQSFLGRYHVQSILGSGGFGIVLAALRHQDGRIVAVKFIEKAKLPPQGLIADPESGILPIEVFILKGTSHPNIVEFYEVFEDDLYWYLVMECYGVLRETMQLTKPLLTPTSSYTPITRSRATSKRSNLSQPQDSPTQFSRPCFVTPSYPTTHPSSQPVSLPHARDLFEWIETHTYLTEEVACHIFGQVMQCVTYLAKLGIIHRDIKDENILIDDNLEVKLVDFGSAVILPNSDLPVYYKRFYGTVSFASPEILKGEPYRAEPAEVWSLGILLYTMLYGEIPFREPNIAISSPLCVPRYHSKECLHLLHWMLCKHPGQRATFDDVIHHPWFRVASSTK